MAKHLMRNRRLEVALGFGSFLLGALLLRDAYDARNIDVPVWARPFTFW